ncbi:MAG TPA: IS1595 family transposase [Stellaceae bacterium]|nr:IS1595 family transposase [Stellaceae bacterium]
MDTIDLTDPTFSDEAKARAHFEATRWPNGPVCPHCGSVDRVYRLKDSDAHRPGLIHCNNCDGSFTVTTGTVMESSHVPLNKWALAFRIMGSAKKGFSAHQLHRSIGVTYRTAWFMFHRIREAMRNANPEPLGGNGKIVEADEVYVGGKPRKGGPRRKTKMTNKTPVAVLVERGGNARATVMDWPLDGAIKRNLVANVAKGTHVHSDEHRAYKGIERLIDGMQSGVRHFDGEYAKDGVHNNTAESWNALLKRGIYGSFHHVSPEHLSRYCDEFVFRWDRRALSDAERTVEAIKGAEGKRLTYRQPRGAQQSEA